MWTFTADGLLGFFAGGSKEKALPEVPGLTFPQELRMMAAVPRATEVRSRSDLFMVGSDLAEPPEGDAMKVLINSVL